MIEHDWHPGGTNPVLPGFSPDPSACVVGDDTYLVTSTFEYLPALPVYRSRDLVTWEPIGHVLNRPTQVDLTTVPDSGGLFAPTIRFHRGTFYVVCTVVGGTGKQGNFVCTATDPAGPWSDPVWWDDTEGFDPSLFFDGDDAWCLGTREAAEPMYRGQTEVWLRRFDLDTLTPRDEEHVIWTGALVDAAWVEGPHLYRRGDHYLLVAAEGGTSHQHAVCVARSDSPTGPYRGNPANPALTHRHLGRDFGVQNVGHADLLQRADGSWWALLLATRVIDGVDPLGRETFLVNVEWEDDWPVFAPGVGMLQVEPPVPTVRGSSPAGWTDAFDGPLDLRWLAVRRLPSARATPAPGGGLLLAADDEPARLLHRVQHLGSTASVTLASQQGAAGLLVRHSDDDRVEVLLDGSQLRVVSTHAGVGTEVLSVPVTDHRRIGVTIGARTLSVHADSTDAGVADISHMCIESSLGFVGLMVGPIAYETAVVAEYAYAPPSAPTSV